MAGWQKLPPSIEALDHEVGLARAPQAPHHTGKLTEQRVMRRRNPYSFDGAGTILISMVAG
jgi:hypothetical protein